MTKVQLTGPCKCGSCDDAAKAALRHFNLMNSGDDCSIYTMRVIAALLTMAIAHYKNDAIEATLGVNIAKQHGQPVDPETAMFAAIVAEQAENETHQIVHIMMDVCAQDHIVSGVVAAFEGNYVADETTKTH